MKYCPERGEFRRGEIIILHQLMQQDCYGYDIIKRIEEQSEGKLIIKEATLYTILKRLEKDELVEAYWGDESNGGRRKYYKITDKGENYYQKLKTHWEHIKQINDMLLQ